jgi:methionyl-tRNA formyltransferase
MRLRPSPVKAAAMALGITVHEPRNLREFAIERAGDTYDLFALASYGRILPQAILDLPRLGALNVHPSMLPKYRGATPIQTALRDGASETGVSIMLMDAGMDTGDIVLQERAAIDPADDYGSLHDRLAQLGAQLLERALDLARDGALPHRAQSGEPSVTAPIDKAALALDWHWPAARIVDAVRAYAPQPAARAVLGGETVKLLRAHRAPGSGEPGSPIGNHGDALVIASGDGAVAIDLLVAPSRGKMTGASYAQQWMARERS